MNVSLRIVATSCIVCMGIAQSQAASGYDLGDMWWNPAESGWGIDFIQQKDVVVATLYVQGPDSKPEWYTSALRFGGLSAQTHEMTYSGDLYEATGTRYGITPYALAGVRRVGSITVVAPTMTTATLTYSIDGVEATKSIRRYTFRWDDYDGTYSGAWSVTATRCTNPADDGTRTVPTTLTFARSGTAMTVVALDNSRSCSYSGPYTQEGRLGRIDSTYTCGTGEVGAMALEEINVQRFGVMGRLFGANNRGCHLEGTFAGLRD